MKGVASDARKYQGEFLAAWASASKPGARRGAIHRERARAKSIGALSAVNERVRIRLTALLASTEQRLIRFS